MLSSHSNARKRLSIHAPDPATEIFLINGQFRRIASAVGELSLNVPEGIYKVRFRSGSKQRDRLVDVSGDQSEIVIRESPLEFKSAAPLSYTSTTREFHLHPAAALSRETTLELGQGSQLFLFARDLKQQVGFHPWEGISLHDIEGVKLADFSNGDCNKDKQYGALNIELNPGTYRLRVETGKIGTYEMFLVTSPDWQTQIFLLATDFYEGKEHIRRVSLKQASVLMSHFGVGFNPDNGHVRLAELARQGLESGRNVMKNQDLKRMLSEKFEDPMLGIYGAHLLLNSYRPNHTLIDIVTGNLKAMLGSHPDVLSLNLRSGKKSKQKAKISFSTPPMLQNSWDLIVRRSLERIATVPAESPAERFAENLLPSSPWLLHRLPEMPTEEGTHIPFAQAKRRLKSLIKLGATDKGNRVMEQVHSHPHNYSSLEKNIINLTLGSMRFTTQSLKEKPATLSSQQITVSQIIRGLDVPSSSISRAVGTLETKLSDLI